MARKEFIQLIEKNGLIMERIVARLHQYPSQSVGYNRQQLLVLTDLLFSGKSKLKEIAHRQCLPTPNLCIMFRKLETEGLVLRAVDETDRRNVWYSVTSKGTKVANQFKDAVFDMLEKLCQGLSAEEEKKLTQSLEYLNKILQRVEKENA